MKKYLFFITFTFLIIFIFFSTDKKNYPSEIKNSIPIQKEIANFIDDNEFSFAEESTTNVWSILTNENQLEDIKYFKPRVDNAYAISLNHYEIFANPQDNQELVLRIPEYGDLKLTVHKIYSSSKNMKHWTGKVSPDSIDNVITTVGETSIFSSIYTDKGQYSLHLINGKGWIYKVLPSEHMQSDIFIDEEK